MVALHSWVASQPWLAALVTLVAEDGIFAIPVLLVAVWVTARPADGRREAIITGGVAAVFAAGLGLYLERTLDRPRPFVELGFAPLFPHVPDSSFPSDHTLVGAALVGALVWGAPRVGVSLYAVALLIGCARIAVGVHYPSDILGSAALAMVIDALAWHLLLRLLPILPASLQTLVRPRSPTAPGRPARILSLSTVAQPESAHVWPATQHDFPRQGGKDELDYDPVDQRVYVTDVGDRIVASVNAITNQLLTQFTGLPTLRSSTRATARPMASCATPGGRATRSRNSIHAPTNWSASPTSACRVHPEASPPSRQPTSR